MVASIRHWALACGVLEHLGPRGKAQDLAITRLGAAILGAGDPYLEQPASLWALYWRLVSTPGRATAWYFAFNEFNDAIFGRELLAGKLMSRLADLREAGRLSDSRAARATVDRDVECLIRTYMPKTGARAGAEDSLECPFAELGLIAPLVGIGAVQFRRGPKPSLPDAVFAFALVEFWHSHHKSRGSLSVETIAHEPGSPGRAFLLDEDRSVERLERLDRLTGNLLIWDESSGLRQVSAKVMIEFLDAEAMLAPLYEHCPPSGLVRQIGCLEERRISSSS